MSSHNNSWRLAALIILLAGSTMALTLRLGYLQIVAHEELREQGDQEHWSQKTVAAHRGSILDADGRPLVTTVSQFNVSFKPDALGSREQIQVVDRSLAPLLGMQSGATIAKIREGGESSVLLKAGVPYETGLEIQRLRLLGVRLTQEYKRVYPEGSTAATLMGFVGKDNKGLTGIEADFNRELGGVDGKLVFERDSIGNEIPLGYRKEKPPQDGADLILTLDRYIQRLIEKKLDEAMVKHKASGGTIIVMDPRSGAILGMASRPTFDANKLDLVSNPKMELYRNRAITDMYEPGSVFKLITMAAGLDTKTITPRTTFYDTGSVNKYGAIIRTWDGRAHGLETMTQVLMNSCNVGAVWAADKVGADKFYEYVNRFGFGQPTHVGLSGEAKGQVRTNKTNGWRPIDLSTNAFGQGISVTPLQMITAVSAIVNGGNLMRPYIVKEVVTDGDRRVFRPVTVRRVISEEAARDLIQMMNAAAEKGESKLAIVPGFHVGGKTSTASISMEKGYTSDATIAGFIGFAPLEDPKFVVMVKIDEPKDSPWGSLVASPIFSSVTQQILLYMKMPPTDLVTADKMVRARP
ncbi:MAG: penicillin-binding protein 2 [Chloroflexi bacterium]|nr:penicillin-binding protein 2 [Chloroflexota bacterium]